MNTRMNFSFYNPTRVLFGVGMLDRLHEQAMPGKNALLLISNGKSTRVNGSLDRTIGQLEMAGVGYAIFDKIMELSLIHIYPYSRDNRLMGLPSLA